MIKNVVIACGLGDFFTFLGRADSFFEHNPEYTGLCFWTWLHHPELAIEMADMYNRSHDKKISIVTLNDMTAFLEEIIPEPHLEKAREHFIRQNPTGVGVEKYLKFIKTFFPNLEEWVYLPVYEKYKASYPFSLDVDKAVREKPYIVVHPYSTTVKTEKPERMWEKTRWTWLLNKMSEYYDTHEIVVIGGKKDKDKNEILNKNITDLRGKTTLEEAVSIIYGACGVIGTNSWPTFISSWAKKPTYAQWFVQTQLIPSHYPRNVNYMPHLCIDYGEKTASGDFVSPKADAVWAKVREVLKDATSTV